MIRRENPDMICIQETHTKEGINPMIRNYTMFSNSWIASSKRTADYINLRWKNNFFLDDKLKEASTKGRVSKTSF